MKYFVEIRWDKKSKYLKKIAKSICPKYQYTIVSEEIVNKIPQEIESIISEEIRKNRKFKQMEVDSWESMLEDHANEDVAYFRHFIAIFPKKITSTSMLKFLITATPVYKDYTDSL